MTDRSVRALDESIRSKTGASTDLSDVARSLASAHEHRPGLFKHDLDVANKALHDKGLLPDVDIVGVKGKDFITRERSGDHKTKLVDSTDIKNQQDQGAPDRPTPMGDRGREIQLHPDGSGKYKVKGGDNEWALAHDMLKGQGNEKPTPNEQANYLKELKKANPGVDLKHLKPGQELTLPPVSKGGDGSAFKDKHDEEADRMAKDNIAKDGEAMKRELAKIGQQLPHIPGKPDEHYGAVQDAIKAKLAEGSLSAQERHALQLLNDNFDKMKTQPRNPNQRPYITSESIDAFTKAQEQEISQQRYLERTKSGVGGQ